MSAPTVDLDLGSLWRGVRLYMWQILGASALIGLLTFIWSRSQPPNYEAQATLLSSNAPAANTALDSSVVRAPPLPEGAVAQALQSTSVIEPLLDRVKTDAAVPASERERLIKSLSIELRRQNLQTIRLGTRLDFNGNGLYTIRAHARTAVAAQHLANHAVTSLIDWDRNRASESLKRAEAGYRAQLAQLENQLPRASGLERQALLGRRASLSSSVSQIRLLQDSVSGVLSPLSTAQEPLDVIGPKPVRNAVLGALFAMLLGFGFATLRTMLDRTVRTEDDLLTLGHPTLANIPRLRQRDVLLIGMVRAARQAGLYEAIGFLRVNLMARLGTTKKPVVMITSTAPGEGKSSLTATLADGMASSGQRILIIDADLRRGTQDIVWKKFQDLGEWRQLTGSGGARTTREALLNPENVQVLRVEENVDMIPAGASVEDSLSIFNQADIGRALSLWRSDYDLVLIDSAPLLALADGLILGSHADAVLMVTEHGRTHLQAVKSALRRAEHADLNVIGFVINKVDTREDSSYSYNYAYSAHSPTRT